jgi:hypothetical protein
MRSPLESLLDTLSAFVQARLVPLDLSKNHFIDAFSSLPLFRHAQ